MRSIDVATPHFTDRIEEAQRLVATANEHLHSTPQDVNSKH